MKIRLLICLFLLLSFRGYSQPCTLNVTLTQSAPTICAGNSITLTASTAGGTAPFTYIWSTGEVTPSINVNKAGTYTVSVSDKTAGCQPVQKSITVTASAAPNAPTASNVVACRNSTVTLTATAPGGVYQWYDAPVGGNFLGSGNTFTTPLITTGIIFYVETTVAGCTSPRTAVVVNIAGNPTVTDASICAGNVATLSVSNGDTYAWYASAAGGAVLGTGQSFTTPVLNASQTYYVVVTTAGCASAPTAVTANVTAPPQAPTSPNISVCSGQSANLHANAPAGVFNWYSVPNGGVSLISSPDYTTPPLAATTIYYVETSINQCVSPRTPVTVTVNPLPAAPAPQTVTICNGTSAALQAPANPAGTYEWYDAAMGGNFLAAGLNYNTPVLNNSTTYYVQADNGGCISPRAPVNVVVSPAPPLPSVSGSIICPGSVTTLTVSSPAGVYQWYNAAAGGVLLATGQTFTTPPLVATTTYYVQSTLAGCISARAPVTVSVLPATAPPVAAGTTVCSGSSATLTAADPNNNYAWYSSANGGVLLSSAQAFVTPPLIATTTYYVETTANGCTSVRTPVTIIVSPPPAPPVVNGTAICLGTSANLTAVGGGVIDWYDAAVGGTLQATGNNFTTPALIINTTYYVQSTVAGCLSTRTPVTVTVNLVPNPQFQYSSGTFCTSGVDPVPVINNPAGGTFSAAPAGLVFTNVNTGQINIAASTPGNYVITFTNGGACPGATSANVAIGATTNANFSYTGGPYCQDGVNPLPSFPGASGAGTFSATPAGLVFVNTSTGEIDLNKSSPGTYTITNSIFASGGCPAGLSTATVTIFQKVVVSAGPNQTIQTGTTAQLAGSITGGIMTGTWSGGTGSFSNPNLPNAVYTPGPGETVAVLTLLSNDPPGPCGPKSDKVTITIAPGPLPPTAAGATVCSGSGAILTATAPGGIYQWWDAAVGGTLVSTDAVFTTPPLMANTTYYVQTTAGGLTSTRTAVVVVVNAMPAAPIATDTQICTGSPTTLTANGSPGTYQWYDSAIGGNLLSVSNTYLTSALTTNVTYYVQTIVNGCISARTPVNVSVTPVPNITSASTGSVCSGNALNYTITADIPAATFSWSRAQVAGISNLAVINQATPTIGETLTNTAGAPINVTYVIVPNAGNCSGPPFNYVVTVNPTPIITGSAHDIICDGTTDNYAITFNVPGTLFTWSRPAVAGIANAAVTGQAAGTIREVLFNTTNAPIDVNYAINYGTSTCQAAVFNFIITVNPQAKITSPSNGVACPATPLGYVITSNVPSATFTWSRAAVGNISNPAVINQATGTINEILTNTATFPINIIYVITPVANGCPGTTFQDTVSVNPPMTIPVANGNSPVCVGSTINLNTAAVSNATYSWTGPGGYTSTQQNPNITNVTVANTGTYNLVVSLLGCTSKTASVAIVVDPPPLADAGPPQRVCINTPAISLAGSVTGGTKTGIWTSAGTGTFSPSSNILNAQYIPSAADKAAGSVTLTLSSTSKDNCNISTSSVTITFGTATAVFAGPNQSVCSQVASVKLNGNITIPGGGSWSTSGTGTFSPSNTTWGADYIPSAADVQKGSVTLTLLGLGAGVCFTPTASMTITFIPPPTVYAGGTQYVLKGKTITLYPNVSDDSVQYLWSPNIDINDITARNPVITGDIDRTYTLTVTDNRGCTSQSQVLIKVSPEIIVYNTFTPNGDGVNDLWDVKGLVAYQQATVDIFNRYGEKVFHSVGYPKPWDGIYNGRQLPVGTYYYIIDPKFNGQPVLSGYVTLIR